MLPNMVKRNKQKNKRRNKLKGNFITIGFWEKQLRPNVKLLYKKYPTSLPHSYVDWK